MTKQNKDIKLVKSKTNKHKFKICALMLSFAFLMPTIMTGCSNTGKSAYDIAVENGFDGTEKEWLESLNGEKGDKGETGETGDKGETGDIGQNGEVGQNGQTPQIGANGNWFINGEDTGYASIGEDGKSATIEIADNGDFIVDGKNTGYNVSLTPEELYDNLKGVIEYDVTDNFTSEYESVKNFNALTTWEYTTSTFSGWAGSIGRPQKINSIRFKVRARDKAIKKIDVILSETKATNVLQKTTLLVNINPNEEKDIVWVLDSEIQNTKNCSYYFGYACDQFSDKLYSSNCNIPKEEIAEHDELRYTVNGKGAHDFSNFYHIEGAQGHNPTYKYLPVQVGTTKKAFKVADSAINKILEQIKVEKGIYRYNQLSISKTVYGYKGQTMQLYLRNICAYPVEDVYFEVKSSPKGSKLYDDRWEYTPTEVGTYSLDINIYSKNWNLLSSTSVSLVINETTKKFAKVLVIGDSTVNAALETQKMVELSSADPDFEIELLGTRGGGQNLHEGIGGWTAQTFLHTPSDDRGNVNQFYNPETKGFDFAYYINKNGYTGVDVVYIQLGINDIFGADANSIESRSNQFVENMQKLVENILAFNKNIKVVINPIIPCDQDQEKFTQQYGSGQTVWGFMRNMYKANMKLLTAFKDTKNVYISWFNAAIDAVKNQNGDVHPKKEGYYQLGTQMYYYLKSIIGIK